MSLMSLAVIAEEQSLEQLQKLEMQSQVSRLNVMGFTNIQVMELH
jgi:hypothetical protein